VTRARRPGIGEHAAGDRVPQLSHHRIIRDAEPESYHLMSGLRIALLLLVPALIAIVLDHRLRRR